MSSLRVSIRQFLASDDGPTAVEYGVMLALIVFVCMAVVTTLGTTVSASFQKVNSSFGS